MTGVYIYTLFNIDIRYLRSEEVVDKHYFVGKDRFYQYLKVIGKYKVIRDAVAERVGPLYFGGA
eukprot:SAG11_NODE_12510_length_699_cov_1.515000_2_plen_64_part_00